MLRYALLLLPVVVSQSPVPQPPKPEDAVVTIRGCIEGRTLIATEDPTADATAADPRLLAREAVQLTGSRQVMAELKDHSGHLDAVSGTVRTRKVGRRPKTVVAGEKRVGRARIYAGRGQRGSDVADVEPEALVVRVSAINHTGRKCR